jgi:hypothetical protein
MASQFPSKAMPMSSPLPLMTGLPELPPVMSLLVMKHVQHSVLPVLPEVLFLTEFAQLLWNNKFFVR